MTGRQESRDRKRVLAALRSAGPGGITALGIAILSNLPEDRVGAALATLDVDGLTRSDPAGRPLSARRPAIYRIAARRESDRAG
jgi:predicted HAD superfamily phosphohydrolase YqeG